MKNRSYPGSLQRLTIQAVARLRHRASGSAIQDHLSRTSGREVSVATVYLTLARLEDLGLVRPTMPGQEPGKSGMGKRIFEITSAGWEALDESQEALASMWEEEGTE